MGKIFYIMGKSAAGKDRIYSLLAGNKELNLKKLVLYTTRPIRAGEQDGVQYYFTDDSRLEEFKKSGKLIEARAYHTVHGIWTYFTADDGQVEDGERLQRALLREREQEKPKYEEMCRRFLADQEDFSEENIREAGIKLRFANENLELCVENIIKYINSLS